MADGDVDISGMPDPADIGLTPASASSADPTAGMPAPVNLWRKHWFGADAEDPVKSKKLEKQFRPYGEPVPNSQWDPSPDQLNAFMANPPGEPSLRRGLSALTGIPRVAAVWNPVTPTLAAAAGGVGALSGAGAALADLGLGHPERMTSDLEQGHQRMRDWSSNVYKAAEYFPSKLATETGNKAAEMVNSIPGELGKVYNEGIVRPLFGDNVADTLADVGQDVGTMLPALHAPAVARGTVGGAVRAAGAAKDFYKGEADSLNPPGNVKPAPITPDVGQPVTAASLRASPNPIPPPEGTAAHERQRPAPAADSGGATVATPTPSAAPGASPAAAPEPPLGQTAAGAGERGSVLITRPDEEGEPRFAPVLNAPIFTSPKDEGPQETPDPATQAQRAKHLDAIDNLSGGMLPSRRESAITGDYNATGRDWQDKETGVKAMEEQVASENSALHGAMQNVYDSTGSLAGNSVDPTTLRNRGGIVRRAIQAIQTHFNDAVDGLYTIARSNSGDKPMPEFLKDTTSFLTNAANYMPGGFRKAALARLNQLKTVGDNGLGGESRAAAPSSIGAAEKFREWLNANRTLDNMHVIRQLVNHTDMDVAAHGGPGLFKAARGLKRHAYQMLEEPNGIRKLLAPSDSQGINNAIKEEDVMDYINKLDRGQHEHVMDVLRAGAHLSPEIANSAAAAIREIQGHTISRLHDAATDDGGKWNARKFYNATTQYAKNAASTFKDRPDILENLKKINDAGNTLYMDKHYPGAVGQEMKATGLSSRAVEALGAGASGLAHELPLGRILGRAIESGTEKMTGKMGEQAREAAVMKRLVDRTGKQRGSVKVIDDGKSSAPPSFVWGEDPAPKNDQERLQYWNQLPKAGRKVDGLDVRDHIPNTDSISGSFDNYHVLSGVREIPFSAFENHVTPLAMPSRLKQLRDEINENKEINPLIVGVDEQGPYIIEGAHRYDALLHLGKTKFPAKIVVGKFDKDEE